MTISVSAGLFKIERSISVHQPQSAALTISAIFSGLARSKWRRQRRPFAGFSHRNDRFPTFEIELQRLQR